ncbi:MAG TPA: hypothetical protein VGM88_14015 [Kofleriaceae bacterium]|jgi:DNA-3-methyladenine glycosylase II
MNIAIPTRKPFSFAQTVAFARRFPPCQADLVFGDESITAAVSVGGRALPMTIRGGRGLTVEVPDDVDDISGALLAARASHFVGASDDLGAFYDAAQTDPAFAPLVRTLYGLHHLRFLTLEEIAVYCVLAQRTPVAMAARMKQKFLAAFGTPVAVGDRTLRAMPEFPELLALDEGEIAEVLRHPRKAAGIVSVVRGVAELGETFLRTAPYADARDALLAIHGVGPFSAAMILLRGLGRMDDLPSFEMFEGPIAAVYGSGFDARATQRRYGRQLGYWAYYLKTGASRSAERGVSSAA